MKILILLTGHRHNEEYKLFGLYLKKCVSLSKIVDIYIHSNCITNNFIDNTKYIKCNKSINITEKNAGFINGGLEAISDIITSLKLTMDNNCEYDYIIHMHPDVFIINEIPLLNLLTQNINSDIIFYVNLSLNTKLLYAFDFFIFNPNKLKTNIFDKWYNNNNSPEQYFYEILHSNNINHIIIPRYNNNFYMPRYIDLLGLWHDHDIYRLYYYLLTHEINQILPIEYSIEEFIQKHELIEDTIWLEIGTIHFYECTKNPIFFYDYNDITKLNNISSNNIPIKLDNLKLDKKISLLNINYNSYNKTVELLNNIQDNLMDNIIIIINNLYNLIDGDFRALYEFIHKNNLKYNYLGLHKQSILIKIFY